MTTTVSVQNVATGYGPIIVTRRAPDTNAEEYLTEVAEGDTAENLHVWADCELVIREKKIVPE